MVKKEKNKFKFYREFLKSSDINQILFKKEKSIDIQLFKYEDIEKSNSSYGQNNLDKLTLLDKPDKPLEASFEKKQEFKINSFLKKDSSLKDNQTSLIDDKKYEYSNNILIEKELIFKKKGYEEGYKKGYEEGKLVFIEELKPIIANFINIVNYLEKLKENIFLANEKYLVSLIFKISRLILLRELSADKDYLLRLVKQIIEKLDCKDNILIKISSKDFDILKNFSDGILNRFKDLKNLKIEESVDLSSGSLQVETEWVKIESNLDLQLEELYNSLVNRDVPIDK